MTHNSFSQPEIQRQLYAAYSGSDAENEGACNILQVVFCACYFTHELDAAIERASKMEQSGVCYIADVEHAMLPKFATKAQSTNSRET